MKSISGNRFESWVVYSTLLCVVFPSNAGCQKKTTIPKRRVCSLDAKTVDKMARLGDPKKLSVEELDRYMNLLNKRCKRWSPVVALMFKPFGIVRWEFKPLPSLGYAIPSASPSDLAEIEQRLNRLCPGYNKVAFPGGSQDSVSAELYNAIWKQCRLQVQGVFSRWEFVAQRPYTKMLWLMYDDLVRGGMSRRAARFLVHVWIHSVYRYANQITTPVSRSTTLLQEEVVDVLISPTEIRVFADKVAKVTNGRVQADIKRDGPEGLFIEPVFQKLRDMVKRSRAAEKQGKWPFRGNLLVAVDYRTPYRLLAEVLYTANQAGFRRYQIVVSHPDERYRVILVQTTLRYRPQKQPVRPYNVTVTMRPSALLVSLLAGAGNQRITRSSGKTKDADRRLSLALWKHRSRTPVSGAPEAWGRALLVPEANTPLQDVVHVLDSLQSVPRDAIHPLPPKGLPKGGCRFDFDPRTRNWKLSPSGRAACLYPLTTLELNVRPAVDPSLPVKELKRHRP